MRFILAHPLNRRKRAEALGRFVGWQVWKRVVRRPLTVRLWDGLRLRAYPDSTAASLVIYTRLPEYDDMLFVTRFLRPHDVVVDVGANIGIYSILAAATARDGTVLAFEPNPVAASRLAENAALNGLRNIRLSVAAIGAQPGVAQLTQDLDLTNHIAVEETKKTIKVSVTTLDQELDRYPDVALIKVDTEGFETEVLLGATRLLDRLAAQVWLVEVNGLGARYGSGDETLWRIFAERGYRPYRYSALENVLLEANRPGVDEWNLLFIRSVGAVRDRLARFRVHLAGVQLRNV
jgi:FkbM family methyltransferase